MRLVFIVYSNSVDNEMSDLVKRNAGGYTKFSGVLGEGNKEPHLGSHVWPSVNNCMMIALNDAALKAVRAGVDDLKKKFPAIGISIMVTDLKKML